MRANIHSHVSGSWENAEPVACGMPANTRLHPTPLRSLLRPQRCPKCARRGEAQPLGRMRCQNWPRRVDQLAYSTKITGQTAWLLRRLRAFKVQADLDRLFLYYSTTELSHAEKGPSWIVLR